MISASSGGRVFQINNVALRNDEDMRRRFGINVFKSVDLLVLVNFLGRNLAGNDFAKEAVVVHGENGNAFPAEVAHRKAW